MARLDLLNIQVRPTSRTATETSWNSRPSSGRDPAKNTSPSVPARGTTQVGHPAVATPSRTDAAEHVPPARAIARDETASTIIKLIRSPIAEEGARISHRLRTPMADSLIMATSKSLRVSCVTDDPHFTEVKCVWIS